MNSEFKIRPLIRKDRVVLTAMIEKMVGKVGNRSIMHLISSEQSEPVEGGGEKKSPDDVYSKVGMSILRQLLEVVEDDFVSWLRSLVNKTAEEFDNLPFDIELDIIEQIVESKWAADFFTRALRLAKKTQGFRNQLQGLKA
jgi:hypothetical protein